MKFKRETVLTFLFLLVILLNLLSSQTSGKINIAVMDLEAVDVSASARKALSDRLRTELFNTGRFSVMERNKMDDILTEQGFQQSGCTSDECFVEVGRLLAVDRIIAGSLGKVGSIYTVSLRMIDVETGRMMLSKNEDCNCPIEKVLTTSLKNVALKMAGLTADNAPRPVLRNEQVAGQGDFYFKSIPTGAKVFIDGKPLSGTTPLTREGVPAGTHQVRMEKGYYSGSQTVFLEPNEFKRVELNLVKAKGSLKIVTTPFEANIFFDNKSMGTSPRTLTGLDAGEHVLKLSKPDYLDHEEVVFVEGGEVKRLNITMEKIKPATLSITSQPPNCDVSIDGQYKGKTPVAVHDLNPGTVRIKLSNPMYEVWQESIILQNGEEKNITPELTIKTGALTINSDPAGAVVTIDGVTKGQTPLTINQVEYGAHTLTISKTDYQSKKEKVEINSAGTKKVFSKLEMAKGTFTFTGSPQGAAVYLNGNYTGILPIEKHEINGGTYQLEVKANGFEKMTKTVTISPNEQKTVPIYLTIKSNSKALIRSLFIPGLGQSYLEKKGKTVMFSALEAGALTGVFFFNSKYNSAVKDYNTAKENYSTAIDQTEINSYYSQMETKYDELESAEKARTIFIGAAVGVWLWNVVDAAVFGPDTGNYSPMSNRENKKLKLFSGQVNDVKRVGVSISF